MGTIPRDRRTDAERIRAIIQEVPARIGGARPVPASLYAERVGLSLIEEGHEIDGQPEVVRGLPRSRFTSTFALHAYLPSRAAECLEDLEAELRATGLIGPDEILSQTSRDGRKFRVKKRNASVDGVFVHDVSPAKRGEFPAFDGDPQPPASSRGRVKGLSGAPLDAALDRCPSPPRAYSKPRRGPAL